MREIIEESLKNNKIEYFGVLSYSDCREISPEIMNREDFIPRSVIVYLVPYYAGRAENLSVYASSLDYHTVLWEISDSLIAALKAHRPDAHFRGYGDHSPINEAHAAIAAGLGVLGNNGLLLNDRYGSYVFIGDVITDIPPEELGATEPLPLSRCHGCNACLRACPTGILRGEGADCLSAITQRKGELREDEIELMRSVNTVWGCDECQSCCPYNSSPALTPVDFFYRERIPLLTTDILSAMSKEQLRRRAFAWRGRKTIERNLELLGY